MIPAKFDYVRAGSVAEALDLLAKHGAGAKLLAGGHSLLPMMKLRLAEPDVLIDLARIAGLDTISVEGGHLAVGALTKHAALAAHDGVRKHARALYDAANQLGDPQVRNRGTIGGSCAHGDPSADYPAVMLALEASFTLAGSSGTRAVSAADFFIGMFETALGEGEMLTEISIPHAPRSAYVKFHHPASHYAVVGVAVKLDVKADAIETARVAVSGVGDAPFRATGVEAKLAGLKREDEAGIRAACAGAARGADARSDRFASAEYRSAMAGEFAVRAVEAAFAAG